MPYINAMRLIDVKNSSKPAVRDGVLGWYEMVLKLWKRWQAHLDRRRFMMWMLTRQDDKWLDDIGLTRNDLQILLDE